MYSLVPLGAFFCFDQIIFTFMDCSILLKQLRMVKKLQFLCVAMGLGFSSFALNHKVSIKPVGAPAVATFDQTDVTVAVNDSVTVTNATSITILLAIEGFPTSLPLAAGTSISYSPTTSGYGTLKINMTSTNPITLPASTTPLVLKEPGGVDWTDMDEDGLPDVVEVELGTNPHDVDTDADGVNDGVEVGVPGFDMDTLNNTNPLIADTDKGGLSDGKEDKNGNGKIDSGETDPNNAADDVVTSLSSGQVFTEELTLYPQPATGTVYVTASGPYKIFNTQGVLVSAGDLNANQLDISSLNSGVYQLLVNSKVMKLVVK
jgi:hypothetical protein